MHIVTLPAHTDTDRATEAFPMSCLRLLQATQLMQFCVILSLLLLLKTWNPWIGGSGLW